MVVQALRIVKRLLQLGSNKKNELKTAILFSVAVLFYLYLSKN